MIDFMFFTIFLRIFHHLGMFLIFYLFQHLRIFILDLSIEIYIIEIKRVKQWELTYY